MIFFFLLQNDLFINPSSIKVFFKKEKEKRKRKKIFNLWRQFLMIVFYHHTKKPK